MIQEVSLNNLDDCIDFAWSLSRSTETNSYPIYESKEKMKKRFIRAIEHPSDLVYAFYSLEILCGVACLEVILEDNYIHATGIYISHNFDEVMSEFLDYLKVKYDGFDLVLGYPKENLKAVNYFKGLDADLVESSSDWRLQCDEFTDKCEQSSIHLISDNEFEEYAVFHDNQFKNMYWTSERLRSVLKEWRIFVHKESDTIDACIFITIRSDYSEIFGVADTTEDKRLTQMLLSQSIQNLIREDKIENVIYFIEDGEDVQLEAANKLGFKYNSSYCCFKVIL